MNLTFSLVLKPTFLAVKDQFMLSIVISVAIRGYLADLLSKSVQIKWPNDILVNEFKICGILIENQVTGNLLNYAIVGIGLNVNQVNFASPTATSVSLIQAYPQDLQGVLDGILNAIEARYFQLRQNNMAQLRDEYLAYLYRRQVPSTFVVGSQHFEGVIMGVDEHGRLQVLIQEEVKIFDTKEIAFADFNSIRR